MQKSNTYVYFALIGYDFDPQLITSKLGIAPSDSWKKGDKGRYTPIFNFSSWQLSTDKGKEYIMVEQLVEEIVQQLFDHIDAINALKNQYNLDSVLEIVLYVDTNEEETTPALGHDLKTIEFLYRTQTRTDIDIYRFNSTKA